MVIEVDESLVFKIKYKRGPGLNESKFGALEYRNKPKQNGLCHIQVARNRKIETPLSIIYYHCNEGSLVH